MTEKNTILRIPFLSTGMELYQDIYIYEMFKPSLYRQSKDHRRHWTYLCRKQIQSKRAYPPYTMFPSYRIAMAQFQFSYQIGLLFSLEHIFFGMILVMERGWNLPILKLIRGVSDSYRSAPKIKWKHIWNDDRV